ncbi:MAG: hypothetical protein NC192_06160, partial [Muribaculaceae bacterium]|nr:hypothetical protein [Muribaculaceae bacterium]
LIAGQDFRCPVVNCYAWNLESTKAKGIGDIWYAADMKITDTVVQMTEKELRKKSNVKKYGDAFTFDDDKKLPELKCFM